MQAASVQDPSKIVLGTTETGRSAVRGFNMHMLSPIILGLSSPLLMIGLFDPGALRHGRLVILALLVSLLVLSTVLFALSLVWPGETTSVIFHIKTRKVEFVQSGLLANSSVEVHFDQIASIGVASRFDRDGYPFTQAEVRLRDGQRVALPPGTKPATVATARQALGL